MVASGFFIKVNKNINQDNYDIFSGILILYNVHNIGVLFMNVCRS